MKRLLWLLVSLMLLCSPASAQELPGAVPTVTSTGFASVSLQADMAVLTLEVSAFAETLPEAEKEAAASVDTLKYALLSAGAQAADITAVRTDVQLERKYHYNKLQEPTLETVGCTVSYQMTVQVPNPAKLSALIDAAVLSGCYSAYGVELASARREEAYQEALAAAVRDGMAKAQALAEACGISKTEILSVTELAQTGTDPLTVTAQVEVTLGAKE